MEIRQLQEQTERVETGPTRFGDDWCGVFIRGDNAAALAMYVESMLQGQADELERMQIEDLCALLRSCIEPQKGA